MMQKEIINQKKECFEIFQNISLRKHFAVWKNAPRDYISIYYPCKIARNENAATKATKTQVKIQYKNKNRVLIFSHNLDGDQVLSYIIVGEKLTSCVFCFFTAI